jgi:threonine/homoserine efflux transporter RhtA
VSDVALLPLERVERERRPAVGYAMALAAGTLFAINGTVSKVILESGITALRLTEVRCVGGFLGLLAIVLLTRPETLRIDRHELLLVAAFGVFGVALVQLFTSSRSTSQIGVSLLIRPLWSRCALRVRARGAGSGSRSRSHHWSADPRREPWSGVSLDRLGVLFALSRVRARGTCSRRGR